jgi:hypothetical protein
LHEDYAVQSGNCEKREAVFAIAPFRKFMWRNPRVNAGGGEPSFPGGFPVNTD